MKKIVLMVVALMCMTSCDQIKSKIDSLTGKGHTEAVTEEEADGDEFEDVVAAPKASQGNFPGQSYESDQRFTDFEWLSQRYVTLDDINDLSRAQLRILRNAIYAMHGRKFKSDDLTNYFGSLPWYNGIYDEIPAGELSQLETDNINFIKRYE